MPQNNKEIKIMSKVDEKNNETNVENWCFWESERLGKNTIKAITKIKKKRTIVVKVWIRT